MAVNSETLKNDASKMGIIDTKTAKDRDVEKNTIALSVGEKKVFLTLEEYVARAKTIDRPQIIDLPESEVTDASVEYLAKHLPDTVIHFNLHSNKIGDRGLAALASRKSIESLCIGGNPITDEGIKILTTLCKALKMLDISHCNLLTPNSGKHIANCKYLLFFEMYNGFYKDTKNDEKQEAEQNEAFVRNLSRIKSDLTRFGLQQTICSTGLASTLAGMKTLTHINLTHSHLSDEARIILLQAAEKRNKSFSKDELNAFSRDLSIVHSFRESVKRNNKLDSSVRSRPLHMQFNLHSQS